LLSWSLKARHLSARKKKKQKGWQEDPKRMQNTIEGNSEWTAKERRPKQERPRWMKITNKGGWIERNTGRQQLRDPVDWLGGGGGGKVEMWCAGTKRAWVYGIKKRGYLAAAKDRTGKGL